MKTIITIFALFTLSNVQAQELKTASLTVEFKGIKEKKGDLLIAIFNNQTDFLKEPYKTDKIQLSADSTISASYSLPIGEYAISVILDSNNNGKLDFGSMGPVELYGFSNNPNSRFGAPEYNAAKFMFSEDSSTTIELQ